MWRLEKRARVYLDLGETDMRKGIQGLSAIVELELEGELFSGDLFAFCNGKRDLIKILYYDRNGFALWQKRLAKDRFKWPENDEEMLEVGKHELAWLLDGLDISQAHEKLRFKVGN